MYKHYLTRLIAILVIALIATYKLAIYSEPLYTTRNYTIPVTDANQKVLKLESRLYLPNSTGSHPGVIITHGSPRNAEQRRQIHSGYYQTAAKWFVSQGFAVLMLVRRGYGNSEGNFAESFKSCKNPDYYHGGLETARDIIAAMKFLQKLPFIKGNQIILVGQSAGGWGTLAVASINPEGAIAAINFAGGRGSYEDGKNCSESELIAAAGKYGQTASLPTLWLYTQNDQYFGPHLSQRMFAEFNRSSPIAHRFELLPAFGEDGHRLFSSPLGPSVWSQYVTRFIENLEANPSKARENADSENCSVTLADGTVMSSPFLCQP